jgi:hypothetical protein
MKVVLLPGMGGSVTFFVLQTNPSRCWEILQEVPFRCDGIYKV